MLSRNHALSTTYSTSSDAFKMASPQRRTIIEWVVRAWEDLPRDTIAAGFRKCSLTDTPEDAAGDDLDGDDELQSLINSVVGQLEEMDVFQVIDWDDIIDSTVV
jgi:hypothetical protein